MRKLPFIFAALSITCAAQSELIDTPKAETTILPAPPSELPAPEQLALTRKIHAFIVKKPQDPAHESYQVLVPKADNAPLKLQAIPGGECLIGEGERRQVKLSPFWMSETEITWAHYDPFWQNDPESKQARNKDGSLDQDNDRYTPEKPDLEKSSLVDAISQPTIQYHDMFLSGSFEHSKDHPAMDMTNHAAAKFCQWLSAQTGHFYRLPTEAEWEYACRAGSTTAYSFGEDSGKLSDYAWFADNADFTYQKVAQKKPNPWGLYDMHGNVAEWTIDAYLPDFPKQLTNGITNPWRYPTQRYPRVIRGGSWDDEAASLRSAARIVSSKDLKLQDPQTPNSVWYHTNAQHIGFRIVRPLTIPSVEEMHLFWNSDALTPERTAEDL